MFFVIVSTTPRDERQPALVSTPAHIHAREVEMLTLALDGKVGDSRDAKDQFIQEFMSLRLQDDNKIKMLSNSRREIIEVCEHFHLV